VASYHQSGALARRETVSECSERDARTPPCLSTPRRKHTVWYQHHDECVTGSRQCGAKASRRVCAGVEPFDAISATPRACAGLEPVRMGTPIASTS
jgi:hypothetical protein